MGTLLRASGAAGFFCFRSAALRVCRPPQTFLTSFQESGFRASLHIYLYIRGLKPYERNPGKMIFNVMVPGYLCRPDLHYCFLRPGFSKRSHVLEVPGGKPDHLRERAAEVASEPVQHPWSPTHLFPAAQGCPCQFPNKGEQVRG
jgi:hypothetical protein